MKVVFITGITGQDGSYLASLLLKKDYKVIGITRSSHNQKSPRLKYLGIDNDVIIEECDLLDFSAIVKLIKDYNPDEIYNLAAQSSVASSFKQPIGTLQYNITSVLNLLEAIRLTNTNAKFYHAASSEMYGKVSNLPITTNTPMHPLSPYAISKATSYWSVINYRESYGLFACCGILFNHESYLRDSNFFIKKIIVEGIKMQSDLSHVLKVGNLHVKRDFGFTPNYVEAMWLMLQQTKPNDFIICSGKSYLLEDIVRYILMKLDVSFDRVEVDSNLYRPTDIEDIYGDNRDAKNVLEWNYSLSFYDVLDIIIAEEILSRV